MHVYPPGIAKPHLTWGLRINANDACAYCPIEDVLSHCSVWCRQQKRCDVFSKWKQHVRTILLYTQVQTKPGITYHLMIGLGDRSAHNYTDRMGKSFGCWLILLWSDRDIHNHFCTLPRQECRANARANLASSYHIISISPQKLDPYAVIRSWV